MLLSSSFTVFVFSFLQYYINLNLLLKGASLLWMMECSFSESVCKKETHAERKHGYVCNIVQFGNKITLPHQIRSLIMVLLIYYLIKCQVFFCFFLLAGWSGFVSGTSAKYRHLHPPILFSGLPVPQCPDCGNTLSTQAGSRSSWPWAMDPGVSMLMCGKTDKGIGL